MSVQAMSWVFDESETTGGARLVLLAIANHHNRDTGATFPGYELLAREARLSRSAAIRAVERLEAEGHLIVERGGGRGQSNRYTIVGFDNGSRNATDSPSPKRSRKGSRPDAETVASEPVNGSASATRSLDPTEITDNRAATLIPDEVASGFDAFWTMYPRKVGKADAAKLWRARLRSGIPVAELMRATRRYLASDAVRRGFVMNPTRFLRSDWEDWRHGPPVERPAGADSVSGAGLRTTCRVSGCRRDIVDWSDETCEDHRTKEATG